MPLAALLVHQLRFLFAYGSRGGSELANTGHSYLSSVTPWLVLVLAIGAGAFLSRLAHVWRSGDLSDRQAVGIAGLWLAATVTLVAIYVAQELLEGLFATGHAAGLIGVFGDGGWWALPAAAAVGGAVALLVRGGRAALRLAARPRRHRAASAGRPCADMPAPEPVFLLVPSPLAACSPGRAPPLVR